MEKRLEGLIRKLEDEEEEEEEEEEDDDDDDDDIIQYAVTHKEPRDGLALFETGTSSGDS
jgi:hypothetical protein